MLVKAQIETCKNNNNNNKIVGKKSYNLLGFKSGMGFTKNVNISNMFI